MEVILFIAILGVAGFFGFKQFKKLEKKKATKRGAELERVRQEERRKAQAEAQAKVDKEKASDPCRDLRDGTFNPAYTPAQAAQHGYFWCSIEKKTLNKSSNVHQCGSQPHLVG